jgi:hypothetical protein
MAAAEVFWPSSTRGDHYDNSDVNANIVIGITLLKRTITVGYIEVKLSQ